MPYIIIIAVLAIGITLTVHNDKVMREKGEEPEYIWNHLTKIERK